MKLKKIIAVLLAAFMLFSFAACTGDTGNEGESQNEAANNDATATLKIGGIGPLTGDAAQYGMAVKLGAELAVKEINAAGGINGYQVEFKMEDDVNDAEKAVTAYNNLKDWGMQMLMGTVTSTPCAAVSAETENDNMLLITPSGSAVDCINPDTAFRVCFSDPAQGKVAADYIKDKALATKVAILYNSSDSYSTGNKDAFVSQAETDGLEVVKVEAFTNETSTDFSAQIANIKDSGAELVFLPIYYTPASLFMKQAKDSGFTPVYLGTDGMDGILGMENIDTTLVEGLMYLTPFMETATDDVTVKFVTGFKEAFPDQTTYLNQFAADAYDAVYAIKAAAEKANVKADMEVSAIGDAMKAAMTQITLDGVTGAGITWDSTGEPTKIPKVVKIVSGSVAEA